MGVFEEADSLEDMHYFELEHLKTMFEGGSPIAVLAALRYCDKYSHPVPQWLTHESSQMLYGLLSGNAPKPVGAFSGAISRYLQDEIDHNRWSAVMEVREARKRLRKEMAQLRKLTGLEAEALCKQVKEKRKQLAGANPKPFELASELLATTAAAGGAEAIRKSYRKVERAFRASCTRYYILPTELLKTDKPDPNVEKGG